MKLKSKLVSLSFVISAIGSFCAFGNITQAKPVFMKKLNSEIEFNSKLKEQLNKLKVEYYENGFDKCESNPVFKAVVNVGNNMTLFVSPTWLKKVKSSVESLENLNFEIIDSEGCSYCCNNFKDLFILDGLDMCVFNIPSLKKLKSNKYYKDNFKVDKGFKFEADKKYKIRLFDSKGNFIVKGSCISSNAWSDYRKFGGTYSYYSKLIAHPKDFDENFYRKSCNYLINKAEEKINYYKLQYYKNDLNKCESNPVFYSNISNFENRLCIFFSPTWLKKIDPRVNFKDLIVEVIDENGHICRFREHNVKCKMSDSDFENDIFMIGVPIEEATYLLRNAKIDGGFKVEVGKKYEIRLFDSKGNFIVEGSIVPSYDNLVYEKLGMKPGYGDSYDKYIKFISKLIAHPKDFDENCYSEVYNYRTNQMKKAKFNDSPCVAATKRRRF